MESQRPLDMLSTCRGQRIVVLLKNNKKYSGVLKSFDVHVNLVIENAEETDGESQQKHKLLFIRGDTIVYISSE